MDLKKALKEANHHQQTMTKNLKSTLVDIKNAWKEMDRYQKKLFEIEEKKMQIMKN